MLAVVAERGTLITFEGIGGSGKSTVAGEVVAWLESQQLDVLFLKEPGGTSLGRELREILVNRDDWLAPWTEAFLFEADRAQTYSELVLDALQNGAVVVFDRGPYGTLAYQASGRQLDAELVRASPGTRQLRVDGGASAGHGHRNWDRRPRTDPFRDRSHGRCTRRVGRGLPPATE